MIPRERQYTGDRCLHRARNRGWDSLQVVDLASTTERRVVFVEHLRQDGRPGHAAPRRVRVEVRQICRFAKAAQIGWYPQGREIALKGLDHLLTKAKSPDSEPVYVHTLAPDVSVADPLRDTYDHSFLALARWIAMPRSRAEIDALLLFFDAKLRSRDGGFLEG
jgi:mannose/cellobiose epimerase-like protein (N-acyl-D-glucosamine 2-epimerase family)